MRRFQDYLKIILCDWTNSCLVNYFPLLCCLRMVLIVSEFPNTNSAGGILFCIKLLDRAGRRDNGIIS